MDCITKLNKNIKRKTKNKGIVLGIKKETKMNERTIK